MLVMLNFDEMVFHRILINDKCLKETSGTLLNDKTNFIEFIKTLTAKNMLT